MGEPTDCDPPRGGTETHGGLRQARDRSREIARGGYGARRASEHREGPDGGFGPEPGYRPVGGANFWELATLAEKAAKAVKVSHGRRPDDDFRGRGPEDDLLGAVKELCWIYECVTGRLPGRDFDHYGRRGRGPFEAFVAAAIKPLWTKKAVREGIFAPQ